MNELLPEYSKEDFESGIAPYEYLYNLRNEPLIYDEIRTKLSKVARALDYKGFNKRYQAYCESISQNGAKLINNMTYFEGQKLELNTGEWRTSESSVWCESGNVRMEACSHPIIPIERLINIDTGTEKLRISFRKGDRWREVIADKSMLASPNTIIKLADNGLAVSSETAKYLIKYLLDVEALNYSEIPEKYSVGRLGWIEGHGFSPYVENLMFDGDMNYKTLFNSVQTKGNEQEWYGIMSGIRHPDNNISARIILAASFASVLVKPCGCLPFFVHLWGNESGTGKTVGLMIAASVWANPDVGTFIQTFNSTVVGREKTAAFCNSLPLIIDELQLGRDSKGKQQFDVYALAEGVGRTRGNKSGGVDKTSTWANCIITSGETPINQTGAGAGAMNRVIDIECSSGSAVVDDGHLVANTIRGTYGHAGKKFIEKLMVSGKELVETYQKYYIELSKMDTTEKQAMAAALILTADKLAAEWVFNDDRNLSVSEIKKFLLTKAQVSLNIRAYEYLVDWIAVNKSKFSTHADSEIYGIIENERAFIIPTIFNRILEDANYSPGGFLSWLKSTGKLSTDQGHLTIKKIINGNRIRCYGIFLEDFEDMTAPFDLETPRTAPQLPR